MAVSVNQQKIAEKLTILCDRATGISTRIYNIKKACGDPKSKPGFLSDRTLEGSLKYIVKKFPSIDVKSGGASVQAINVIRQDITKSLSLYYFTFVDLLDLKDHITEALTTIDACQLNFDLALNYDLTAMYLTLIVRYVSLMILLSRVDDRKAVLGLYNAAYELQHGNSEQNFPRLGQMILDYDPPLKKLAEEFNPHSRVLLGAIASLAQVYSRRNLSADEWRKAAMLSLTASPQHLLLAAHTDTIACEYLSLDEMERWIIFGLTMCHQHIALPSVAPLWTDALQHSLVTQLFRDEVVQTHSYIQAFFETIKGYGKKSADVKEYFTSALQNACLFHRERRKFLRSTLRELSLLLSDQPGLLGPKVLFVWMALSFSRDEVNWLIRHTENWPHKSTGKTRLPDDLVDRQLPELLFLMEELRGLVCKYAPVIRRYHLQYLSAYDAIALNEFIQNMGSMPEEESMILSSFCKDCAELTPEGLTDDLDFRGLRLDWCRLQSYMSCARSAVPLRENPRLAYQVNQLVFHSKMVDWLDQMLIETSDLSLFCFYSHYFENAFTQCLEFPSQARYICAFPQLCAHFQNSLHELCPEEREHVNQRSLAMCSMFLEDITKEARELLTNIADHFCALADRTLPKHCARRLNEETVLLQKQQSGEKAAAKAIATGAVKLTPLPGSESERRSRDDMTVMDKLQNALSELCSAINYYYKIVVCEHTFAPREYLTQSLEERFNKCVVGMAMYDQQAQVIAKPSELLSSVRAYMNVLQSVENLVNIDITRILNNVLLQQTQPQDCRGQDTITALYTKWYLEVLLRRVSTGQILYTPHQLGFIPVEVTDSAAQIHFNPQEYTDFNELRALCDLLGPYGVKFMSERLMWHVASQIQEMKKLVVQNRDVLRGLRSSFDKPEKMKELHRQLAGPTSANPKAADSTDSLLQRLCIVGEILCFKDLLENAMNDVLSDRAPFLLNSLDEFKRNVNMEHPDLLGVCEMFQACGVEYPVDALLVSAIKAQKQEENAEDDYVHSCLLMVFIAVSLAKLAKSANCVYKASIAAHLNNAHCIAKAVNTIAGALFTIHTRGDVQDRMKEFLALASGSLLRLSGESSENEVHGTKESVYLLLDKIVEQSSWLTVDVLQTCFPYALIRSSYHYCHTQEDWLANS